MFVGLLILCSWICDCIVDWEWIELGCLGIGCGCWECVVMLCWLDSWCDWIWGMQKCMHGFLLDALRVCVWVIGICCLV